MQNVLIDWSAYLLTTYCIFISQIMLNTEFGISRKSKMLRDVCSFMLMIWKNVWLSFQVTSSRASLTSCCTLCRTMKMRKTPGLRWFASCIVIEECTWSVNDHREFCTFLRQEFPVRPFLKTVFHERIHVQVSRAIFIHGILKANYFLSSRFIFHWNVSNLTLFIVSKPVENFEKCFLQKDFYSKYVSKFIFHSSKNFFKSACNNQNLVEEICGMVMKVFFFIFTFFQWIALFLTLFLLFNVCSSTEAWNQILLRFFSMVHKMIFFKPKVDFQIHHCWWHLIPPIGMVFYSFHSWTNILFNVDYSRRQINNFQCALVHLNVPWFAKNDFHAMIPFTAV